MKYHRFRKHRGECKILRANDIKMLSRRVETAREGAPYEREF